jgi:hypothetical protein
MIPFDKFNELQVMAGKIVNKNSKEGLTAEVKNMISRYYALLDKYNAQYNKEKCPTTSTLRSDKWKCRLKSPKIYR